MPKCRIVEHGVHFPIAPERSMKSTSKLSHQLPSLGTTGCSDWARLLRRRWWGHHRRYTSRSSAQDLVAVDHGVKALVRKGNRLGTPQPPFDFRIPAPGYLEHFFIGVQSRDGSAGSDAISRGASKNAHPAGHIEDTLVRSNSRGVRHDVSPLMEQRRNEELVVHFRWGTSRSHFLIFTHLAPPICSGMTISTTHSRE